MQSGMKGQPTWEEGGWHSMDNSSVLFFYFNHGPLYYQLLPFKIRI